MFRPVPYLIIIIVQLTFVQYHLTFLQNFQANFFQYLFHAQKKKTQSSDSMNSSTALTLSRVLTSNDTIFIVSSSNPPPKQISITLPLC